MTIPSITPLPDPPQRSTDTPTAFVTKADAWVAALVLFIAQLNAFAAALVAAAESVIAGVASVNGKTGTVTGFTENDAVQTLANKTLTMPAIEGAIREEQAQITGTTPAISPADGSIRYWTLTANSTPTKGAWNDGEGMTIHVADGPGAAVNWTPMTVTWVSGAPPALPTSGWAVIELWQVNGVLYGAYAGAVA